MSVSSARIAIGAAATAAALAGLAIGMRGFRRRKRAERIMQEAVADIAAAGSREAIAAVVRRALDGLLPSGPRPQVDVVTPAVLAATPRHRPGSMVPVSTSTAPGEARIGALLVDPVTASRGRVSGVLRVLSAQAALAMARLQLTDDLALRDSVSDLGALVEQTTDVILIVDGDNRIRYASPSARTVLGTTALDDLPLLDLIDAAERRPAEYLLSHARDNGSSPEQPSRADWTIEARDGRKAYVEMSCRPLRPTAPYDSLVVTLRDVTTQRQLEHELTRRVFHDPLTGLPNRQLFGDRLRQVLDHGDGMTGVLVVDLDNFKSINEGFGHAAGDTVLAAVGQRIRDTVQPDGVVGRLGDDEFAALLPDLPEPEQMAARLADALAYPIPAGDDLVSSTASIGVATSSSSGSVRELLRHADLALAAAKAAGPGHWRRYDPSMAGAAADRVALRADLSRATGDGSLGVEYQPIVALDSGRTVGLEALVRWRHPTRGRLHPADFVDVAEESGLIGPIGEWVLATAMARAAQWRGTPAGEAPYLSVNVSAHQFQSGTFVDTVNRLLTTTRLPPGRLVLEVTESSLLGDGDRAWADLHWLRSRGVRVAIDDFGTGYSGLGYLRHAPLDLVKLDRVFTGPLTSSARQRDLVTGIVRLARSLNLDVVAEGIETSHERDISAQVGAGYGQGYFFGRPASDPEAFLT